MSVPEIYAQAMRHLLSPIVCFLDDDLVSEVMVVGHKQVYVEKRGKVIRADGVRFEDEFSLLAAVRNIAEYSGREIDEFHHSIDARLPSGARVHAIIPPASRNGVCLTIRKFQSVYFDQEHLLEQRVLTADAAEFLSLCVQLHKNMVISGGTGTGKTTMLNALSAFIPKDERIVVIEDSSELRLNQEHTVYLEAQSPGPDGRRGVSIRDLFVDSLRMRPDRIIVGEVRRGEALDLIQSMISGHAGSLTTVHANNPRDAVSRLETLCLFSDADLPVLVARAQVASAVHLVVQLSRLADGSRRIMQIAECCGLDDKAAYHWNDLFRFRGTGQDQAGNVLGQLEWLGNKPSFADEVREYGFANQVDKSRELFG